MKIYAKCIVPSKFAAYTWPDSFAYLPRQGDIVRPSESDSVELLVDKVIHKNFEKMNQPPTYETRIELYLVVIPPRQLTE
jgi:hypothetical protein